MLTLKYTVKLIKYCLDYVAFTLSKSIEMKSIGEIRNGTTLCRGTLFRLHHQKT